MKKLLSILLFAVIGLACKNAPRALTIGALVSTTNAISQNYVNSSDFTNHTYVIYKTNSPGNTHGNRFELIKISTDTLQFRGKTMLLDSMAILNSGDPIGKMLWISSSGQLRATSMSSISIPYNQITGTPAAPTTYTVARPINSATFQVSATKTSWVYYTVRINCTASIGSASSGTVNLQYSTDNGSTWVDVGQLENSNTVSLAIVLNSNTIQTGQLSAVIPAGAIVRMNSSSAGTTSITFMRGNETY